MTRSRRQGTPSGLCLSLPGFGIQNPSHCLGPIGPVGPQFLGQFLQPTVQHPLFRSVRGSLHPRRAHHRWYGSTARHAGARPLRYSLVARDCETGRPVLSSLLHAMLPETARHSPELLGSCQSSFAFASSGIALLNQRRPLPSTEALPRPLRYCGPLRHPTQPSPAPRGRHVVVPCDTLRALVGISRVATEPLSPTCCHQCPGGLGRLRDLRSLPAQWQPSPRYDRVGIRIAWFRDLLSVHSHYGLFARCQPPDNGPFTSRASVASLLRRSPRLLPAGAKVAGWVLLLSHWSSAPFHGAP